MVLVGVRGIAWVHREPREREVRPREGARVDGQWTARGGVCGARTTGGRVDPLHTNLKP